VALDDVSDDDDDDEKEEARKKSGCLPHRPRSATLDTPGRRRRCDSEPTRHHSKLAEKLLRFFRPGGGSGRGSPTGRKSPTSSRGGGQPPPAPPRRRFMRVVKDENAPPPESVGDNPNVICRYSQEYLTRHYAELERRGARDPADCSGSRLTLPYTTSGHTILKKSSTDPTSDRSERASSTALKHTTFCDVVTVVDSDLPGDVHQEHLRDTSSSDDDEDEMDNEGSPSPSSRTAGFFLNTDLDSAAAAAADETDAAAVPTDLRSAVNHVDQAAVEKDSVSKDVVNSGGLMSIFSTAARPRSVTSAQNAAEEAPATAASDVSSSPLRSTKHVKLVDLMAQIRADDDERS